MIKSNGIDLDNVFIECGPLLSERHFSGIPSVTAHFVEESLQLLNSRPGYFHGPNLLNPEPIEKSIIDKHNEAIREEKAKDNLFIGQIEEEAKKRNGPTIGIFTNSRHNLPRIFDYECQIVYDLTPLVTPEFHHQDTINFHVPKYLTEFQLADLLITISEASKKDMMIYTGIEEEKILVSYPAVGISTSLNQETIQELSSLTVEPYILMVGTIEPRKNHSILFDYINSNPSVLEKYKFIFAGKDGWLISFQSLMESLTNVPRHLLKNIIRLGFISETMKTMLIKNASFLVFPSFYEGFGMPVIEAMQHGCPVLASCSSSIPEAGGKNCEYFDPHSAENFAQAFEQMHIKVTRERSELAARAKEHASQFTWSKFTKPIYERIVQEYQNITTETKQA